MITVKERVISEHIFLFPFSWACTSKKKRYRGKKTHTLAHGSFEHLPHWRMHYLNLHLDKEYNEFVYFHKPIRAALYTMHQAPIIVRNYTYHKLDSDNYFVLGVGGKQYELHIESINLKLYKTRIGLVSIRVSNDRYSKIEDIEAINSFSKCIYPPMLPLSLAREELFPDYIEVKLNEKECYREYFEENYHQEVLLVSPLIMSILGEPFTNVCSKVSSNKIKIEPIVGNQMFCLCLYKSEELVEQIKSGNVPYEVLERLMTINRKVNYQQPDTESDYIGSAYYLKSEESIYAISRFALACVAKRLPQSKLYDQLVSLVLMQRATLLSISTEIAYVSTMNKYELSHAISKIYELYIQFMNQLYFKEVTEDAQGAKIYEQLSSQLKVQEELEQLNFEIDEVHEYVSLVEQAESRVKVELLTIIGAALVLPSFVTSLFGMNIFQREILHWWNSISVALWMNTYVVLPILVVCALCTWNRRKTRRYIIIKGVYLFLIGMSLFITYYCGCGL